MGVHVDIVQTDRTAGAILGAATGDALGAGYEFGLPLDADEDVMMRGGGPFGWAAGEWTDDTSMMFPILEAVAAGRNLTDESVQDAVVAGWIDWAKTAPDVGNQLRAVLSQAEPRASSVRSMARLYHERVGHSAGNGSLMRTAPVALAYLDDPEKLAEAARAISDLTHFESDAGDACVLWSLAVRHAVRHGELDLRLGLAALPAERRRIWSDRIDEAEANPPSYFSRNGWVVQALQGAWSAIWRTGASESAVSLDATQLRRGLEDAVRGGRDTDTVAAIAGALLGARHGSSALPAEWRLKLHGWPGATGRDLGRLAVQAAFGRGAGGFRPPGDEYLDYSAHGDISALVKHPADDGVWLGAVGALDALPEEVDAIVSLCRVGSDQVPPRIAHRLEVCLDHDVALSANLDFVLVDTVDAIAWLRSQGHAVLLHCVGAQTRTPAVAALYAARHRGVPVTQALADAEAALPNAEVGPFLRDTVIRLAG